MRKAETSHGQLEVCKKWSISHDTKDRLQIIFQKVKTNYNEESKTSSQEAFIVAFLSNVWTVHRDYHCHYNSNQLELQTQKSCVSEAW